MERIEQCRMRRKEEGRTTEKIVRKRWNSVGCEGRKREGR